MQPRVLDNLIKFQVLVIMNYICLFWM
jgi:hypothetical protein